MNKIDSCLDAWDLTNKVVLIGCSGGVDSMVLLHLLVQKGVRPHVLHINYQLRGEQSDLDEALVVSTSKDLGLSCQVEKCPVELTQKKGVNLQAAAREFRFHFFRQWIAQSENHCVFLGHHSDDQVETFFLALLRGSGMAGLGGMELSKHQIYRPLLNCDKSEIRSYAVKNGIKWREDMSNSTSKYRRNWLRNEFLPLQFEHQPQLKKDVLFLMEKFRSEQQRIQEKVMPIVEEIRAKNELDLNFFFQQEEVIQFMILKEMRWEATVVEQLKQALTAQLSAVFKLGNATWFKTKDVKIKCLTSIKNKSWLYKVEVISAQKMKTDLNVCYLPLEINLEELSIQTIKADTKIKSLGMQGAQLVKKVMKDAGIAQQERTFYPVLFYKEEVLWIPGIKRSRLALVQNESQKMYELRVV